MAAETTRRALFGAAGLVAVAAAVPIAAKAAASTADPTGIRPAFQAAFDAIAAADRVSREHGPIHDAARRRYLASADTIPHIEFTTTEAHGGATFSTADNRTVSMARRLVERWREQGDRERDDFASDARKLVAAANLRDRKLARISRDTGMDAAHEQDSVNGDAIVKAEDDFLHTVVASAAELAMKVQFINDRYTWDHPDSVRLAMTADAAALAAREVRA